MAESIPSENLISTFSLKEQTEIQPLSAITGGPNENRYLLHQLLQSIRTADQIDIIVAFLMESGVKLILKDLKAAQDKGASIRILTGNYLGITQPSALWLIRQTLGEQVDLRFYNDPKRSFHPKSYIFHSGSKVEIYIGSSNISRSALTAGIEWNYRFTNQADAENCQLFIQSFEDLFYNHSICLTDEELKKYSKNWHRPAVSKDLDRFTRDETESESKVRKLYEPRGVQIEALCALENARADGASKGLVHAATGIGKTFLAAFDSRPYKSVLFVAHREEILKQAAISFRNVRSEEYGFFAGNEKTTDKPIIFASVATLGQARYLTPAYFAPDAFEYIVIDEFHHAVNQQYIQIINYFKPKFLLGLTATPERMDRKDVYALMDYTVPYELPLQEAINKGVLCPFHYYGIYDPTDYSDIHLVNGRYAEHELNAKYIGNHARNELIIKHFRKHHPKRALGFCCSRAHAEEMARVFCEYKIPACAVYSGAAGTYSKDRTEAIKELQSGKIKVVFTVDMFNEGVDIPDVDTVLFMRPTESPTVFLQQLGRGLRKSKDKSWLTVLDFIGNYEKAGRVRFLLNGKNGMSTGGNGSDPYTDYPDDCLCDFDMKLIDLFEEMDQKKIRLRDRIRSEYDRIKEELGHRPTRMELFSAMDDDIYSLCISNAKENIFKDYLNYAREDLSEDERGIYRTIGREFLLLLENTNMTKVYKMPVLFAFYNHGHIRMQVTQEELLKSWKSFFSTGTNWKDLSKAKTFADYQKMSDKAHLRNIMSNPVHFLEASGKGFFVQKEGYALALREELADIIHNPAFAEHMEDIISYRTADYYQRRYRNSI